MQLIRDITKNVQPLLNTCQLILAVSHSRTWFTITHFCKHIIFNNHVIFIVLISIFKKVFKSVVVSST